MLKLSAKILAILLLGAIGGFLYQAFLLPYLANKPYFARFQFIRELKEREVIVYPKEEIIIQENSALKGAIERTERVVVGIKSTSKTGAVVEGSGLIVSSDGLLVTFSDILPLAGNFTFFVNGKRSTYQVLKRDPATNLALVKVEEKNLPTVSFGSLEKIRPGERVFLVATIFDKSGTQKMVNEGIIKIADENFIQTSIYEKENINGSPLFDIEGNALGLCFSDKEGNVLAVPISEIKSFVGF